MAVDKATPEYLATKKFFNLLGAPEEYLYAVSEWTVIMRDCLGETQFELETFYDFLRWAINKNPISAEYLRNARDPQQRLRKTYPPC